MTEELWFILIFWIITVLLGFKFKNQYFMSVGALVGIFLGFLVISQVYVWFGMILIFSSIYLLYHVLFPKEVKKK